MTDDNDIEFEDLDPEVDDDRDEYDARDDDVCPPMWSPDWL